MASATIAAASSGDNTIVAAVAAKRIRVLRFELSASAAVNAKWKDGASTDLTGLFYAAGAGPMGDMDSSDGGRDYIFQTSVGNALVLNLSAAVPVGGVVDYTLE
jgi:hypothetical protein